MAANPAAFVLTCMYYAVTILYFLFSYGVIVVEGSWSTLAVDLLIVLDLYVLACYYMSFTEIDLSHLTTSDGDGRLLEFLIERPRNGKWWKSVGWALIYPFVWFVKRQQTQQQHDLKMIGLGVFVLLAAGNITDAAVSETTRQFLLAIRYVSAVYILYGLMCIYQNDMRCVKGVPQRAQPTGVQTLLVPVSFFATVQNYVFSLHSNVYEFLTDEHLLVAAPGVMKK